MRKHDQMNPKKNACRQKTSRSPPTRAGEKSTAREPAKKYEYLTDHEVRLLVEMRKQNPHQSLRWLARKFEVSLTCVARILKGLRRSDVTGIEPPTKRSW